MANEMMLKCDISGDLAIAENVAAVCENAVARAECAVSDLLGDGGADSVTAENLKEVKELCTRLNKTVEFVSQQRIDFEKRLYAVPSVARVVEAFSGCEKKIAGIRLPLWIRHNEIKNADKPADETLAVSVSFSGVTLRQLENMKKNWAKNGISFSVESMSVEKKEEANNNKE